MTSPGGIGAKTKVIHRQIINESHPAVKKLVEEYEFYLEASIEAVKLCGTVNEAIDYLVRKETDKEEGITAEFEPMMNYSEIINEE